MATVVPTRPRTTSQSLRISMLLLLITVGVPGCLTGAAARSSSTAPRASAAESEQPLSPGPVPNAGRSPGPVRPAGRAGQAVDEPPRNPGFADRIPEPGAYPGPDPYARPESDVRPESLATRSRAAGLPGPADNFSDPVDGPADPAGTRADPAASAPRERAAPPPVTERLPPGYRRSLAYSGLFGLVISVIGLTMVGSRRRLW